MIREGLKRQGVGPGEGFRERGREVSRVEGFSDAVFGFALTLLVVSLQVPQTFNELLQAINGFFAFGVSFALLTSVWFSHYRFFRRYGLDDRLTLTLNSILLFVILFYVYPLKFLFNWLIADGAQTTIILPDGTPQVVIELAQIPQLLLIYGLGFAAIFLVFALLNLNAYRQREALDLNSIELMETRQSILSNIIMVGIGLLSAAMALLGGPGHAGLAGWIYVLIAPVSWLERRWTDHKRRALIRQLGQAGTTAK